MTADNLTVRPLFISRIAMFAFVLVFLGGFWAQEAQSGSGPPSELSFESVLDGVALVAFHVVLLWVSWRNWRLGVRLSASEVTVLGFFRDRAVARSAVVDIPFNGCLVWEGKDGKIRLTQMVAFSDLVGGLAGIVVGHNERCLALLRREILGAPPNDSPGGDDLKESRRSVEDDRSFDRPTYLRAGRRQEAPKHATSKRNPTDAVPAIAILTGSILLTVLALGLVIEPALWLAGITETPGVPRLISRSEPYSRDSVVSALLQQGVLAALAMGMTVRLLYFMLRRTKSSPPAA